MRSKLERRSFWNDMSAGKMPRMALARKLMSPATASASRLRSNVDPTSRVRKFEMASGALNVTTESVSISTALRPFGSR